MFYQTLIYEKQIEQKSEHWPVVEAGEKWSVHTLEFVLADIDESGGMDHVRREIIYHIAEIISLYIFLSVGYVVGMDQNKMKVQ